MSEASAAGVGQDTIGSHHDELMSAIINDSDKISMSELMHICTCSLVPRPATFVWPGTKFRVTETERAWERG